LREIVRAVVAFLIAPVPAALLMALIGARRGVVIMLIGAMVVSWLAQVIPGLPMVLWVRRLGARRWWHYVLTGMAIYGLATLVCMVWNAVHGTAGIGVVVGLTIFSLLIFGAPAGLTVWLILGRERRRPAQSSELDQLRHTFD
jgi:hypothetical protein